MRGNCGHAMRRDDGDDIAIDNEVDDDNIAKIECH